MPKVIVQTDDGREVWSMDGIDGHVAHFIPSAPGNARTSALMSGMQRAVRDAEAIQEGRDHRRPSEIAVALAEYVRQGKLWTQREGKRDVLVTEESEYGFAFREVYPRDESEVRAMPKGKFERLFRKVDAEQIAAVEEAL